MLYGAPSQAIHLATDLRSGAREAADRDRAQATVVTTAVKSRAATSGSARRPLLAALRQQLARRPAAGAAAR